MSDFAHIHASLLNRVPIRATRRDLDYYRERADLLTTTETSALTAIRAFTKAKGWDYFRPRGGKGQRQTTVTWRSDVFERAGHARAALLTDTTWRRAEGHGGVMTPPIYATVVPLRHLETGRKVYVLAAHLPSSVEGGEAHGYTDGTPLRVKAHRESLEALQALVEEIRRDEPDAAILFAADFNLNHRRAVIRDWLAESLDPLTCVWAGRLPKTGTHGKRVIDASYVRGLVVGRSRVFGKRKSDHRAYRTTYSFPEIVPPSRGGHVDAALGAIERALRWNTKHETEKVGPLREARKALRSIDPH